MTLDEQKLIIDAHVADLTAQLQAGAVITMAAVLHEGQLTLVIGTHGHPKLMKFIGERMYGIGEMMVRAAESDGDEYNEEALIGRTPPLGRG